MAEADKNATEEDRQAIRARLELYNKTSHIETP
jgi:hypothetical protein